MMTVENTQREGKAASLNDHRTDSKRATGGAGLANLSDACQFHDGRFLLPLCKVSGLFIIRVDVSKPLTVLVKHSGLPVMVLPPSIFPE